MRHLEVETLAIVTPFDDASNRHVRDTAESQGFEVTGLVGLARPGYWRALRGCGLPDRLSGVGRLFEAA